PPPCSPLFPYTTLFRSIGIVAAPCVGPVVISLITLVAQLGQPVLGGAMFAALAFGLGFPYLVALNALPRPGEWMVTVKKGMGFRSEEHTSELQSQSNLV